MVITLQGFTSMANDRNLWLNKKQGVDAAYEPVEMNNEIPPGDDQATIIGMASHLWTIKPGRMYGQVTAFFSGYLDLKVTVCPIWLWLQPGSFTGQGFLG